VGSDVPDHDSRTVTPNSAARLTACTGTGRTSVGFDTSPAKNSVDLS
jgi:hypothetical protein